MRALRAKVRLMDIVGRFVVRFLACEVNYFAVVRVSYLFESMK